MDVGGNEGAARRGEFLRDRPVSAAGRPTIAGNARSGADRIGWIALLVGTAIIGWSGVLARFLDIGPSRARLGEWG
jgi:hypothetical protein